MTTAAVKNKKILIFSLTALHVLFIPTTLHQQKPADASSSIAEPTSNSDNSNANSQSGAAAAATATAEEESKMEVDSPLPADAAGAAPEDGVVAAATSSRAGAVAGAVSDKYEWVKVPAPVVQSERLRLLCSVLRLEACSDSSFQVKTASNDA